MSVQIINADVRQGLTKIESGTVDTCITSPPYWGLRDYGSDGQIGLESTPNEYVATMVEVFRAVRRVLRDDGTLWLNLGDCYNAYNHNRGSAAGTNKNHHEIMPAADCGLSAPGLKQKDLVGIPWRVAFALQADDWYLRSDIIWSKPNPMPESVTDRPTKAHEYIFLLSKSARYYYDINSIREPHTTSGAEKNIGIVDQRSLERPKHGNNPAMRTRPGSRPTGYFGYALGRNRRTVWNVPTKPYPGAHFATFPPDLIRPCILAGCPRGEIVLDPFAGSGTTGMVAEEEGRNSVLIEINPEYCDMIRKRTAQRGLFASQGESNV